LNRNDFISFVTAAYAAPEVIKGNPYDPMKSDVWSLGVILFIMLYGVMPFDDSRVSKLIQQQRDKKFYIIPIAKNKLSADCIEAYETCLNPIPEERPESFQLFSLKWLKKLVAKYSHMNETVNSF
jgi:serine kinase